MRFLYPIGAIFCAERVSGMDPLDRNDVVGAVYRHEKEGHIKADIPDWAQMGDLVSFHESDLDFLGGDESGTTGGTDSSVNDDEDSAEVDDGEDEEDEEDDEDIEEDEGVSGVLTKLGYFNPIEMRGKGTLFHDGESYVLRTMLGEGGNGIVLQGKAGTKTAAIKFVLDDGEAGSDDLETEFSVLKQLQDIPGVVKVFGTLGTLSLPHAADDGDNKERTDVEDEEEEEEVVQFMVLEGLAKSLPDHSSEMTTKPSAARETFMRSFAYAALVTLEQVHAREIAHCDIHRDAFMTTAGKFWKVIDFGKATTDAAVGGDRHAVKEGIWKTEENLWFLSLNELGDQLCTPRDDLVRLGEVLFRAWPASLTEQDYSATKTRIEKDEKTKLKNIQCFKKTLSFDSYYPGDPVKRAKEFPPVNVELGKVFSTAVVAAIADRKKAAAKECLPATDATAEKEEKVNFIQAFYERVAVIGPEETDLPYAELKALLIDGETLTADEAAGIAGEYTVKAA